MKKIKYLIDIDGEKIECGFCSKEITSNDEIEYSREHCEFYCCPEHATAKYLEYEGSKPLSFVEAQTNIQNDKHGWNVF